MATNVESNSGKCKVNVSVDCPCKLIIQGCEIDAVPGDKFYLEQEVPSLPTAFFIQIKDLPSVVSRVASLRHDMVGRLNAVRKISRPENLTFERGYISCRENSLSWFIGLLDEIIEDYMYD